MLLCWKLDHTDTYLERFAMLSIASPGKFPFRLLRSLKTAAAVDQALLLRLCTVLYQQQHASDAKLHARLRALTLPDPIPDELFLQLCTRFPFSWRPVHRFLLFSGFSHSPTSFSKMLDVFGKAKNVDLLWTSFRDSIIDRPNLLTPGSLVTVARYLGDSLQIKKLVLIFDSIIKSYFPALHSVDTLNLVVEALCARKLVGEAKSLVSKLNPSIAPDERTYGLLIIGFCKAGDLAMASKLWNRMAEEELEPEVETYDEMILTLFKTNRSDDALRMFNALRDRRIGDVRLASYRTVIEWICKQGRIEQAYMVFAEMLKRGVGADEATIGAIVYGLLVRRRIREGYRALGTVERPDIRLCHGLMKGLLRLKRPGEATGVFREMIRRGIEPIMHTYIMLLQGHLGKRGRKARDPLVNFESIFVGGLVKAGRMLQATKFAERMMWSGVEVPRFDYNKFLHSFSNEEGVVMFEEVGRRLRKLGMVDLGDIFLRYGEKMATRDRRRRIRVDL